MAEEGFRCYKYENRNRKRRTGTGRWRIEAEIKRMEPGEKRETGN